MSRIKHSICYFLGKFCKSMAIFGVNSCCYVYYSQDKEPDSLKKYKKH